MTDWGAKWFEIRAEKGESDMATMMYQDPGKPLVSKNFLHREADGLGKIESLLQHEGIHLLVSHRKLKRPASWKNFFLLLRGIRLHPVTKANPWKNFVPNSNSLAPDKVASLTLSADENKSLQTEARALGVNPGFYILSKFDQILREKFFRDKKSPSHWLSPVDLRGAFPEAKLEQLCVSFVVAKFDGDATQDTSVWTRAFEAYKKDLKREVYWAFYQLYQIGQWIGVGGMRWLVKRTAGKSFWMGSFSDLGVWNQPELKTVNLEQRRWVIAPPGSPSYPVGLTTIEWCGQRHLTLKLHPAIAGNDAQKIAEEILQEFSKNQKLVRKPSEI